MKTGVLFVEGDLDMEILSKIVPNGILIVRANGKKGMKAFIDGYRKSPGATKADFYVGFRDRDFDYPMNLTPSLTFDGDKLIIMHRRTIENYFFTPASYEHFYNAAQNTKLQLIDPATFDFHLTMAVSTLIYYQAARQALGEVRKSNPLESTWTSGSGDLPLALENAECEKEALEYLFKYLATSTQIANPSEFKRLYQKYITLFTSPSFDPALRLEWFQGKDIAKAFMLMAHKQGFNFSLREFYTYTAKNFDHTQFPDFVELIDWLSNKLKTS